MQKMRIFVASPSDMEAARTIVKNVASSLKRIAENYNITIDVIDWSTVVPNMGRPEQVILDQLRPNTWDIFVGILWHRFGTPSGRKNPLTDKDYLSGTEEEFKTAYLLWQQYQRPRIIIYKCNRAIPTEALDLEQYKRVQDFFHQFESNKGEHPGLYKTFLTYKSFEKLFHDHMQELLIEYGERLRGTIETESAPSLEFELGKPNDLEPASGALKPNDPFYVERGADQKIIQRLSKIGSTITIQGASQTGKSSLLIRGLHHTHSLLNTSVVHIDLQSVEYNEFVSPDRFLRYLAIKIVQKLKVDIKSVDQIWRLRLSSMDKLATAIEEIVLPNTERQIILAIDEADRLLDTPFSSDFFALMRSWHNNRAVNDQWNKLSIVIVTAIEPYLLISSVNQSPFNVGLVLHIDDFEQEQVRDLNNRFGGPIKNEDFDSFYDLLHGHPYLTREALYLLVKDQWTFEKFMRESANDQGPFGNHLINQFGILWGDQLLQKAFIQIMEQNQCDDHKSVKRLLQSGLIRGRSQAYYCRCELYERHFRDKFR